MPPEFKAVPIAYRYEISLSEDEARLLYQLLNKVEWTHLYSVTGDVKSDLWVDYSDLVRSLTASLAALCEPY